MALSLPLLGLIVFIVTTGLIPGLIVVLTKKGVLDIPRVQSCPTHQMPTPRGGGLVVMPVIFMVWGWLLWTGQASYPSATGFVAVIAAGIFLCFFTWFDDHRPGGLRVRTRLFIQVLAVSFPLFFWPAEAGRILPSMPFMLERFLMVGAWLWFSNLFNFMDGINGISGWQAISICTGLLLFSLSGVAPMPAGYEELLITVMSAAAGFLVWNGRTVAKIFLGDVGSIGLGFCLAWLLFVFAAQGHLTPAILVSLVYCMDATITLLKRAWQKKQIWQAHREHFYHRATVKGALNHAQCVGMILFVNATLIGLGWLAIHGWASPAFCMVAGLLIVTGLLRLFFLIGKRCGHKSSPRPKPLLIERWAKLQLKKANVRSQKRAAL